jgi:hypothetical protein
MLAGVKRFVDNAPGLQYGAAVCVGLFLFLALEVFFPVLSQVRQVGHPAAQVLFGLLLIISLQYFVAVMLLHWMASERLSFGQRLGSVLLFGTGVGFVAYYWWIYRKSGKAKV